MLIGPFPFPVSNEWKDPRKGRRKNLGNFGARKKIRVIFLNWRIFPSPPHPPHRANRGIPLSDPSLIRLQSSWFFFRAPSFSAIFFHLGSFSPSLFCRRVIACGSSSWATVTTVWPAFPWRGLITPIVASSWASKWSRPSISSRGSGDRWAHLLQIHFVG